MLDMARFVAELEKAQTKIADLQKRPAMLFITLDVKNSKEEADIFYDLKINPIITKGKSQSKIKDTEDPKNIEKKSKTQERRDIKGKEANEQLEDSLRDQSARAFSSATPGDSTLLYLEWILPLHNLPP